MRRSMLAACAAAAVAATPAAARTTAAPPGATARCVDGTYSFSAHHSGTCSHHHGVATWLDGGTGAAAKRVVERVRLGSTVAFGRRTRTASCRLGVLPDRRCSPGAYSSGLTAAVLCSASFRTGTVRNVPQSEKDVVEAEYGLTPRPYGRALEIDHIVPLELGGSNDLANLFPERAAPRLGYHVKDVLENRLHALVCSGAMQLRAAQRAIARDWRALYRQTSTSPT